MTHKLFSLFLITLLLFLPKISFSNTLCDLERLQTIGPFQIICNYLDRESFKNFNFTSKTILKKILDLNKISEERNEEEAEELCQKFERFLDANRNEGLFYTQNIKKVDTSPLLNYFRLFTFDKMKESEITQLDIENYHSLQQGKFISEKTLLKFMQKKSHQQINDKIYNCFSKDFNTRFKNYNLPMVDCIDLAGKKISFLSPCISKCTKLTHLFLHKNNLQFLPIEIKKCKKLVEIYLADNKLESLPLEISEWESISKIVIFNNNIRNSEKIRHIFKERKVEFFFDWSVDNSFPSEDNAEEEN